MIRKVIAVAAPSMYVLSLCALAVVPEAIALQAEYRPGYDYSIIVPADEHRSGKVEVRELFLYTSGWSRALQPYLQRWLESKPDYIEYVREPAIAFPHARPQARMYYTLKEMGREELHTRFFDWAMDPKHFSTYHTVRHPDEKGIFQFNLEFAKVHGIDARKFADIYNSPAVTEKVIGAEMDTHGYLVNGTSTIVIDEKYSTSLQRFVVSSPECIDKGPMPENFQAFFRLIDALAESEKRRMAQGSGGGTRSGSQSPAR